MRDGELSDRNFTGLVQRFSAGETELFGEIVHGYCYKKMVKLANCFIRRCRIRDPAYQGEDAVGETEAKLWQAARGGTLPAIPDGAGFWGLFYWTLQGVILHKKEESDSQKRGGSWDRVSLDPNDLHSPQPTPAEWALAQLECQALLEQLHDSVLKIIVQQRLDGYTNPEIARHFRKPVCFVERRLRSIRATWHHAHPSLAV